MIIFEAALQENNIRFYREENPVIFGGSITYFFSDISRLQVDQIIIENKMGVGTQTIKTTDYPGIKKMYRLYAAIAISILILLSLLA